MPLVSIDHLGLTNEGFEDLKELVEQGVYVKATGFGRIEVEPIQTMRELMDINRRAHVWYGFTIYSCETSF